MTKAYIIREIAGRLGISLKAAKTVLEAILDGMARAIREGDHVEIRGFGTFTTRVRNARKARNPLTGVGVDVPRKRIPVFKTSAELKALVNGFDKSDRKERA